MSDLQTSQANSTIESEFDERLSQLEIVFHAPPFSPETVAAIKLIAPQFDFRADEHSRCLWEKDQNGSCWSEYEALAPIIGERAVPGKVLEIGPGVGRSVVFFKKKLGWDRSSFHLYEATGYSTKYMLLGPRFRDSFCGNIDLLMATLKYNGVCNASVFDARIWNLADLPGPYDLIYSFYSIGFHWSLEYFLNDISALMHQRTIAIFTVPDNFVSCPGLDTFFFRIVDYKTVWPKHGQLRLLVLSKDALP
jgi:hypothetical protein